VPLLAVKGKLVAGHGLIALARHQPSSPGSCSVYDIHCIDVQDGRCAPSSSNARLNITEDAISIGTAKKAPRGPHSQAKKAMARKTANGFSSSRCHISGGVMNWPSIVTIAR